MPLRPLGCPLPCTQRSVTCGLPGFGSPQSHWLPQTLREAQSPRGQLPPEPTPGRFPEAMWGAEAPAGATSHPVLTPHLTPRKGQVWGSD